MDSNKNNKLERDELVEGFGRLGVNVNEDEVDQIMHYFDIDDDNHISINEFIRGIRVSGSTVAVSFTVLCCSNLTDAYLVLRLTQGTMSKARKDIVREAFRRLDNTGDGEVTVEDLIQVRTTTQVLSGRERV